MVKIIKLLGAIKRLVFFFLQRTTLQWIGRITVKRMEGVCVCVWTTDFDFTTFINKWTGAEQGFRKYK